MAHTVKDKDKLLLRVRRITGQLRAVERALESEQSCSEVLQLIAAARGAINGLMAEVMIDRRRDRARGAAELIQVVRTYLK
jgi:DNA-binding FrmR family transcriptional regulator